MGIKKTGEFVMFVDARNEEEMCFPSKISISINRNGNICGVYTYGRSLGQTVHGNINLNDTIPFGTFKEVTKIATLISKTIYGMLDSYKDGNFVNQIGGCLLQRHIQIH